MDKSIKIKSIIKYHIESNKKEYIIISIIFIVGIFLGVLYINNTNNTQMDEIKNYFSNYEDRIKNAENLNLTILLKNSILNNFLLAIIIWFFATTVIRNTSCIWNYII